MLSHRFSIRGFLSSAALLALCTTGWSEIENELKLMRRGNSGSNADALQRKLKG